MAVLRQAQHERWWFALVGCCDPNERCAAESAFDLKITAPGAQHRILTRR